MAIDAKKQLKKASKRNYLAKDFQAFRNELYSHAKLFFSDKIQDFTEPGLGGLLLDMASYVGDSMSYYLDHQFNELSLETAVEEGFIDEIKSKIRVNWFLKKFTNDNKIL